MITEFLLIDLPLMLDSNERVHEDRILIFEGNATFATEGFAITAAVSIYLRWFPKKAVYVSGVSQDVSIEVYRVFAKAYNIRTYLQGLHFLCSDELSFYEHGYDQQQNAFQFTGLYRQGFSMTDSNVSRYSKLQFAIPNFHHTSFVDEGLESTVIRNGTAHSGLIMKLDLPLYQITIISKNGWRYQRPAYTSLSSVHLSTVASIEDRYPGLALSDLPNVQLLLESFLSFIGGSRVSGEIIIRSTSGLPSQYQIGCPGPATSYIEPFTCIPHLDQCDLVVIWDKYWIALRAKKINLEDINIYVQINSSKSESIDNLKALMDLLRSFSHRIAKLNNDKDYLSQYKSMVWEDTFIYLLSAIQLEDKIPEGVESIRKYAEQYGSELSFATQTIYEDITSNCTVPLEESQPIDSITTFDLQFCLLLIVELSILRLIDYDGEYIDRRQEYAPYPSPVKVPWCNSTEL